MRAQVAKSGEVTVVYISGQINYETVDPFRETCMRQFRDEKVVFNLQNLNFVGSSGITQFIQTIGDLASSNPSGLKLCRVGSEFKKVFVSGNFPGLEIYEEQAQAENAFLKGEEALLQTAVHPVR